MNNSAEIFEIGLGLTSPWFLEKVSFETINTGRELHIYLNFQKGFKFKSEEGEDLLIHNTMERTWQDLHFFQHKCYLHARVPRVRKKDNKVVLVDVPWARKNSGLTLLFEAYSMLLIENEIPVSKASKIRGVNSQQIWTVFDYWI
jgi:transposase